MTHDYNMDAHMDAQGGMGAYDPPAPRPKPSVETDNTTPFTEPLEKGWLAKVMKDVRSETDKDTLIAELRQEIEMLRYYSKNPNTCGHAMNFCMMGEGGNAFCTVCEMDKANGALAAAKRDGIREGLDMAAIVALELRCEKGTPWDSATRTVAAAIRAKAKKGRNELFR